MYNTLRRDNKQYTGFNSCKFWYCRSCTFCEQAATKERLPFSVHPKRILKYVNNGFLCRSFVFCQTCTKCCTKPSCRGLTEPVLENLANPWGKSQSCINVERGFHTAFSDQTSFDQVTKSCQLLCTTPWEPRPGGGIASAERQKCSRVQKSEITGVLQSTVFSPKTQQ